jgi:hypothetical protein
VERTRNRCWRLFEWFCRIWLVLFRRPKRGDPCVYIPDRCIHRPDPCIYSQFMLMQLEQPVTWDNPDVAILRNGVEQNSFDLVADTEYQVVVTVHNSSRDRVADGTEVAIRWIEFGAGAQIRHAIATLSADVPLWPGTVDVTATWRTPASPGHYCIEVELAHPADGNPANNRGWNNTQVHAAASLVETPIRVFNRWPTGCPPVHEGGHGIYIARAFAGTGLLGILGGGLTFHAVDHHASALELFIAGLAGYPVGAALGLLLELVRTRWRRPGIADVTHERVPCELVELTVDGYRFVDQTGKDADPDHMFAPRPSAWPATLTPALFHFQPGETYRDVVLRVDAPDEPGSEETFNVSVRQGDAPTGGVTVTVRSGH